MAPAAYHRIVYAGEDSQDMHRVGSVLMTAATVPLALGLVGDVYVVITKIVGTPTAGLIAGSLALVPATAEFAAESTTLASACGFRGKSPANPE
jgi:hypothetical protein